MRTLALLTALLILAFQAQAQTKHKTSQQAQGQFQAKAKGQGQGQGQAPTKDQDVVIILKGKDHLSKGAAGFLRKRTCTCRTEHFCRTHERHFGSCKLHGTKSELCCH